jgi:hypothetical protein
VARPGVDGLVTVPDARQSPAPDRSPGPLQVQILCVPDCPLVARVRAALRRGLAAAHASAVIEEVEGPYPSPTVLIDRVDVTGRALPAHPMCRLDLPTDDQLVGAIRAASRAAAPLPARRTPR